MIFFLVNQIDYLFIMHVPKHTAQYEFTALGSEPSPPPPNLAVYLTVDKQVYQMNCIIMSHIFSLIESVIFLGFVFLTQSEPVFLWVALGQQEKCTTKTV